jgi:hypothetical protein
MENKGGVSESSLSRFDITANEVNGFLEEIGIHILLEVTLVAIVDRFLNNTVLSMLMGISVVEVCQLLWRRRRDIEED